MAHCRLITNAEYINIAQAAGGVANLNKNSYVKKVESLVEDFPIVNVNVFIRLFCYFRIEVTDGCPPGTVGHFDANVSVSARNLL
jgi:hypothetical protein